MKLFERTAIPAALLAAAWLGNAQEPPANAAGGRGGRGEGAAIAAAKEDPAAVDRGGKVYASNCAGCHGATARGNPGAPDLVRSMIVLTDEKGILISPVLRNGRPEQGMPKPNLSEAQISDVVAWLHVQTYSAGHRNTYEFLNVLTGDAKKGEAYFNSAGGCTQCHSAGGDLKGVGSRYDAFALQGRWLQPRGGRGGGGGGRGGRGGAAAAANRGTVTVKVTLPSGETVSGPIDRVDDFSVSLHDASGKYRSFTREGDVPKVEINDPLKAHVQMLGKYTDAEIHNVTAYLVTLK